MSFDLIASFGWSLFCTYYCLVLSAWLGLKWIVFSFLRLRPKNRQELTASIKTTVRLSIQIIASKWAKDIAQHPHSSYMLVNIHYSGWPTWAWFKRLAITVFNMVVSAKPKLLAGHRPEHECLLVFSGSSPVYQFQGLPHCFTLLRSFRALYLQTWFRVVFQL